MQAAIDMSNVLLISATLAKMNIKAINEAGIIFVSTDSTDHKYKNHGLLTLVEKYTDIEIGYVNSDGKIKLAKTWCVNRYTHNIEAKYSKTGLIGANDVGTNQIIAHRNILQAMKLRLVKRQSDLIYQTNIAKKSKYFTSKDGVTKWFKRMLHTGWYFNDYKQITFGGFNVANHSLSMLRYRLDDEESKRIMYMDMSIVAWNNNIAYLWLINADVIYTFDFSCGSVTLLNSNALQFTEDLDKLIKLRSAFKEIGKATSKSVAYTFLYTHAFWRYGRYSFMFVDDNGNQVDGKDFTSAINFDKILIVNNEKQSSIATISYKSKEPKPGWYIEMPNYGKFHLCGHSYTRHMNNIMDKLCNESSMLINRLKE